MPCCSSSSEFKELGYPKIFAKAYEEIYKKNPDFDVSMPNNILAIEYLKALKRTDSKVCPLPINRVGAGYNDGFIKNETLQSASAIRSLIKEFGISAFDFVPNIAKDVFTDALEKGQMPADGEKLSTAVISQFRLNPPVGKDDIHDAAGGLYNRLYNNSFETNSISSLTLMTETKRYTRARIRRAIFNSYFGVTSSEIRNAPAFTQVLALDSVGRSILKGIPKSADFSVITKPAEKKDLSSLALKQRERSLKADSVYRLCFETFVSGNESLKTSPFVKK